MDIGAAELVEIPAAPLAGARKAVAFDQAAGDGHEQGPGKIGRGLVEDAGGVGGDNFAASASGKVDIVKADGNVSDDAKFGGDGKKVVVDFFGEETDERVFVGDTAEDFVPRRPLGVLPVVHLKVRGEELARSVEEFVRGEDAGVGHMAASARTGE